MLFLFYHRLPSHSPTLYNDLNKADNLYIDTEALPIILIVMHSITRSLLPIQ